MQNIPTKDNPLAMQTMGSVDGGFAQYCVAKAKESFPINCDWSDIELASIPISYSTAWMLCRADIQVIDDLIRCESGRSAAIQLAKVRGAKIRAQCAPG